MQARRLDVLVVCNVAIEAFIIAKLRRLLLSRTRVVCADLLVPRKTLLSKLVRSWLKEIDVFVCIHTGDIETLQRLFKVPRERFFCSVSNRCKLGSGADFRR